MRVVVKINNVILIFYWKNIFFFFAYALLILILNWEIGYVVNERDFQIQLMMNIKKILKREKPGDTYI